MIRILLADDQALVRGALATLLGLEDDLEVIAQVGRGDEVLAAVAAHRPDIALLDVEMPGIDGLSAAAQVRTSLSGRAHRDRDDVRPRRISVPCAGRGGVRIRRQGHSGAQSSPTWSAA